MNSLIRLYVYIQYELLITHESFRYFYPLKKPMLQVLFLYTNIEIYVSYLQICI